MNSSLHREFFRPPELTIWFWRHGIKNPAISQTIEQAAMLGTAAELLSLEGLSYQAAGQYLYCVVSYQPSLKHIHGLIEKRCPINGVHPFAGVITNDHWYQKATATFWSAYVFRLRA